MRRRYIDRIRVQETIAAIVLAVLALCVIALFVGCLDYDVPLIRVVKIGQVFPGGPYRVIYEQNGNQYSQIFRTREDAESWIK